MSKKQNSTRHHYSLKRKGTGTVERHGTKWYVRVSLPDGTRPRYPLPDGLSQSRREDMAQAISERERVRVRAEVERQKATTMLTVRQFGELWTSGELYRRHGEVRGLRLKRSADDDAWRLAAYMYPLIGDRPVASVTELDIERIMAEAPKTYRRKTGREMRQATKFQVFQVIRRLFDLAIKPGRLRKDSPVSADLRPSRGKPKLFGYLYPSEVLSLLGCCEIPLRRRVLYALAVYTGLRKGSLYALRWGGIDFTHRTLTSLESKTGLPQLFELEPGLATLTLAWYERRGQPDADAPVVPQGTGKRDREAEDLREDLRAAGVTRAMLFGGASNVQPIRFHDLRATFTTWALRQGRGKFWIQDRTGHITDSQLERYARQARTLADLKLDPFPDISDAIPELAQTPNNVRRANFGNRG